MTVRIIAGSIVLLTLVCSAAAQKLPSRIEGYKVYDANVVVTNRRIEMAPGTDVLVRLDEPKIDSIGLTGATVSVTGDVTSVRSGQVERVVFRDFRINGVAVGIETVKDAFPVKTGSPQPIGVAIKVSTGPVSLAKAGYRELSDPKIDWQVTGTLLLFGRFDRLGFTFKRVIPVKVALTVKNPLRSR